MTIDELARRARTTTRNVRALQTLGLIPRPLLRGRRGVYGREHLDRIRAVLRLQSDGFSLAAIAALIQAWEEGMTLEEILGLSSPRLQPASDGSAGDGATEDLYGLELWPMPRRGSTFTVVPTTVLSPTA